MQPLDLLSFENKEVKIFTEGCQLCLKFLKNGFTFV